VLGERESLTYFLLSCFQAIFPVRYDDKFYREAARDENRDLIRLAFNHGTLIGAICCRLEANDKSREQLKGLSRIYIMTLGVLAPYRGYGIGSKLLNTILAYAASRKDISDIFLHVQINNTDAMRLYKRFGFEVIGLLQCYYKRIEPADAYVLSKGVTPEATQLNAQLAAATPQPTL